MRKQPRVLAGEPELHCWCGTCEMPTRIRIPLHIGDTAAAPASVLEICPGCGTGHDRPSVAVSTAPQHGPRRGPLVAAAHAIHARICRRRNLPATGCAHGDCPWPGLHRRQHQMPGEDGTWRYLFCTRRHLRAWARQHQLTL